MTHERKGLIALFCLTSIVQPAYIGWRLYDLDIHQSTLPANTTYPQFAIIGGLCLLLRCGLVAAAWLCSRDFGKGLKQMVFGHAADSLTSSDAEAGSVSSGMDGLGLSPHTANGSGNGRKKNPLLTRSGVSHHTKSGLPSGVRSAGAWSAKSSAANSDGFFSPLNRSPDRDDADADADGDIRSPGSAVTLSFMSPAAVTNGGRSVNGHASSSSSDAKERRGGWRSPFAATFGRIAFQAKTPTYKRWALAPVLSQEDEDEHRPDSGRGDGNVASNSPGAECGAEQRSDRGGGGGDSRSAMTVSRAAAPASDRGSGQQRTSKQQQRQRSGEGGLNQGLLSPSAVDADVSRDRDRQSQRDSAQQQQQRQFQSPARRKPDAADDSMVGSSTAAVDVSAEDVVADQATRSGKSSSSGSSKKPHRSSRKDRGPPDSIAGGYGYTFGE